MSQITQTFAALADPTRFEIVDKLLRRGELPAGTLAAEADISAPAISRHLKVLRQAGVVHQRVVGTHRYYSVRPDAMRGVHDWTMDHSSFWAGSLDRLDSLLAIDPDGEEE